MSKEYRDDTLLDITVNICKETDGILYILLNQPNTVHHYRDITVE
jgi:hypothetical protein